MLASLPVDSLNHTPEPLGIPFRFLLLGIRSTREIPIVMAGAADPIGNGFIASLSRPGGNITGVSGSGEILGKGIELLREVVPRARRFAVLANTADPFSAAFERLLGTSARSVGVQLVVKRVRPPDDLRAAFAEFVRLGVDGLIVRPSLVSQAVADLALQHRLPSIAGNRAFAESGA